MPSVAKDYRSCLCIRKMISERADTWVAARRMMISLSSAHRHINMLQPLGLVSVALDRGLGLVCGRDMVAETSCPSVDSSLKDGFAVVSTDIDDAIPDQPVTLRVVGSVTAGEDMAHLKVGPGKVVRIMTGAPVPPGATAILASEFARIEGDRITVWADARPGRNILYKGSDIQQGQLVVQKDDILTPTHLGLAAAAGLDGISCYRLPKVAVAATGSELVWPGEPVTPGKVAASNMVTAAAELRALGINASAVLLRDNLDRLRQQFAQLAGEVDVLITCGGVLDGDKDLTLRAMEEIGMEKIFHRVRIGPGKGACMGKVGSTVVFNLPGGPPSNHVALLLLALPGVRRLMGYRNPLPGKRTVRLTEELVGQENWTQLVYCRTGEKNGARSAVPLRGMGRLQAMAAADALVEIPEGCGLIEKDSTAEAWFL